MGWASHHIEALKSGKTTTFRPRGNSMTGRVNDILKAGDVVLCRVRGAQYQIGNNRGDINGWVSKHAIFGVLISVSA